MSSSPLDGPADREPPVAPWRKYARLLGLGLQEQVEYRANALAESLVGIGSFFVAFLVWSGIYAANGGAPIGGLSRAEMLTYVLLSRSWDWIQNPAGELDSALPEDIRNGGLSRILARPIDDRGYRLCLYLSHRIASGVVRLVPVVVLMCLLPGLFSVPLGPHLLLLPLVMALSMLLQFSFSYAVALMAFWFLSIGGLLFLKRVVVSFLAGAWIPLVLLPPSLQRVSELLPFHYMVFFPARLAQTAMPAVTIFRGCCVMCGWIVALWGAGALLWARGLRRYVAAGI
jgi:ABC-2 type transport system permease protein